MKKPGRLAYQVRLRLLTIAGKLIGTVDYPTGHAVIRNGTYTSSTVSFSTVHVPQFASGPVTIQFDGQTVNGELQLASVDEDGVATGVAHKLIR
jgi:hypothetical protein